MNAERRWWKRPSLFSLLIVILATVWMLSEVACFVLARAGERRSRRMCLSNIRCFSYGCGLYGSDREGDYPASLGDLYPYLPDSNVFLCPGAGKATRLEADPFSQNYAPTMLDDTHTDYVWVSGLRASDPPHYILAFDDEWNHDGDGVNVLEAGENCLWIGDIEVVHAQLARQEKELAAQGRMMKLLRPAWSSWPDPPVWPRPRPWYARRGGRAVVAGVLAAVLATLALVIRTVRRRRKQGTSG